jgi:hypothetical protein
MIDLLNTTRQILEKVEEKTGKSVQLMQDDNLAVLATLQMARNGAGFHILRYKPTNDPLDYLITFQAGYVLRLYDAPPNLRFDLTSTHEAHDKARSLLALENPTADSALVDAFAEKLATWALMSLRSIPVGMRIDHWIRRTYMDLHDQQDASLALQQQQNVGLLSMNLQGITVPNKLLGGLAAYALFVDDLTGQNTYSIPYAASGLLQAGQDLMSVWRNLTDSPEHDCALVDSWAHAMGIADWYDWKPFQP